MRVLFLIPMLVVFSVAQTIMCYKEAVVSPSAMDTAKLSGTVCEGKTIKDMQKDGWNTKDIQMTKSNDKLNFVYVFTKGETNSNNPQQTKATEPKTDMKKAKEIFTTRCSRCHKKQDKDMLKHKTFDDFMFKLSQYGRNDIKSNNAYLMTPVSNSITEDDAKMVFDYIHAK